MPDISITAVGRPFFNARRLQGRLLALLNAYLKKIEFDLESITLTWDHQPNWEPVTHYAGGDLYVRVTTDDPIFGYLDEGTSIRWALMSRDFQAKTQVRTLSSFPGSGHAVLRGKSAMTKRGIGPRPGIDAREWTVLIEQIRGINFQLDADQIFREELGEF